MDKASMLQLGFLVLLQLTELWAFPGGPPSSTCEAMHPHHSPQQGQPSFKPQSGASPFNITVSNSSYAKGQELIVTISASGSRKFKGFILQARGNGSSIAWPVGEFTQLPSGAQFIYCSGGDPKNTAAHNNTARNTWSSRQFTWKAPAKSAGDVKFWATVVEDYSTFWADVTSSIISGPPEEDVTRGVPSTSFQIDKTGCNQTKGCFSLPSNCTGSSDCDYLFTYQVSGENVTMEMSAKQRWVSVAFNEKKFMDKMDSIMCATLGTNLVEVRHFYSHGHELIRQDLVGSNDIFLEKIVYENGGITCRVTRKLTPTTPHFRDLKQKWYLLFAHATTAQAGSAQYHYKSRFYTPDTVDLAVPAILVDEQSLPTPTPSTTDMITKDGCGKTKSCHSEPADCKSSSDCTYLLTYKAVGDDEVEFEISAEQQWVAIGFNKEKKEMPGTDALICADVSGQVSVDHYVADNGYDTPTKTTPRPAAIKQDLGVSNGGVVKCRFTRKKKAPNMADLTELWYLVFAYGPMSGDVIGKHSVTPPTSSEQVDVSKITVITAEKVNLGMIQAHGCLMVIAWVGLASIGIFMARYMKAVFGEKMLLGTKLWFTFHRGLMVFTVITTIVAIILIFVHSGRWTEEAGAHPITGIIVLVLAVIQPIMALFRPHPGEDNRYIFNWAHRSVGISALILAVVTIFLGIRLDHLNLDDSALYAMIAYCVGVAIVIVFDIYLTMSNVGSASFSAGAGGKDAGGHVQLEPSANQHSSARKLLLGFLVLLVVAVVVTLVVMIALAGEGHSDGDDHH